MMNSREKASLDRYITGNYGEDQFRGETEQGEEDGTEQLTLEELREFYAGYKPWFNPIDADEVDKLPPCKCGGKMRFEGLQSPRGNSRVAIAYCAACGHAWEF